MPKACDLFESEGSILLAGGIHGWYLSISSRPDLSLFSQRFLRCPSIPLGSDKLPGLSGIILDWKTGSSRS
jgi:hypothetical protein